MLLHLIRQRVARSRVLLGAVAVALGVTSVVSPVANALPPDTALTHQSPMSAFTPTQPCRLLDTRDAGRALSAQSTLTVQAAVERCGIDLDVTAVSVVVAVTQATGAGFLTAWPTGQAMPTASSINWTRATDTIANSAVLAVSADGKFNIFASDTTHVVVDVNGYFAPAQASSAGRFVALDARRLIDTRLSGRPAPGGVVTVARPSGVPDDAVGLAVTLTTTQARGAGYFTVFPAGTSRPLASALNTDAPGQTRAAGQIVKLGAEGFNVYSSNGDHVIVDVTGYWTGRSAPVSADGLFVSSTPTRLIDTRSNGEQLWRGGTREFATNTVTNGPAAAVVANWTITEPNGPGFMVSYPARTELPATSTVNSDEASTTVASMGVVPVSTSGVAAYSLNGAHLVADVTGWFTGTPRTATASAPVNEKPPIPAYPTGACDTITAGLGGLNGPAPAAFRQIGTSVQGRPIIAEYWGPANASKVVIAVAQVHGNECSPQLLIDEVRTNPPTAYGMWLIPTLNPDGHATYSRRNANGVDLNADGFSRSQPETQALMAFTAEIKPVLTVHAHSPNGTIGWYGTERYRRGNPSASGAPLSSRVADIVSANTGLQFTGAGARLGSNWFLWQGQQAVWSGGESVLVEFHAVAHWEVPYADPRPRALSVNAVRAQAQAVMAALDTTLR